MRVFIIIYFLTVHLGFSQETKPISPINTPLTNNNVNFSMPGSFIWTYKSNSAPTTVLGSNYLFNNWFNSASIYTIEKKGYKISGINFNVKYNRFEARLSDVSKKDSTFVFSSTNIDKVVIGNQEFVKIEFKGKGPNYFIEVVQQGHKVSLLKSYSTRLIVGASNPMTKEKILDDKIIIIPTYYIERNGQLEEAKLKKSSMLKLMSDKKSDLKEFLKNNKISFKKEDDIKKLFIYYNSI